MARISSYPIVTPKEIDTLIISQGYDIDADEPIEGNPTGSVTIGSVIDLVNTGLVPGTGTVTSLGVSMPSAFTVSNSPVTTTGVINITGSGTSTQYIDGTGSLQDSELILNRNETTNSLGNKTIPSNFDFTSIPASYANSILNIIHHHDLSGATITLPAGVTLNFTGGKFSNGTLTGVSTQISAGLDHIFETDISFSGTWSVKEVYPQWFGAVNDDTVDSSDAFEAWINKLILTGKKGFIPAGNYLITRSLSFDLEGKSNKLWVEGVRFNTIIKSTVIGKSTFEFLNVTRASIRNFSIVGNGTTGVNGNGHAISLKDTNTGFGAYFPSNCVLENLLISKFRGIDKDEDNNAIKSAGIYLGAGLSNSILGNYISECGVGIYNYKGQQTVLTRNVVFANDTWGIVIDKCEEAIVIDKNNILGNGSALGVYSESISGTSISYGGIRINDGNHVKNIQGNKMKDNISSIVLLNADMVNVENNHIRPMSTTFNGDASITSFNCNKVNIEGNNFLYITSTERNYKGIYLRSQANNGWYSNIIEKNNFIYGGTIEYDIKIHGNGYSNDVFSSITKNTFGSVETSSSSSVLNCIILDSGKYTGMIKGNLFIAGNNLTINNALDFSGGQFEVDNFEVSRNNNKIYLGGVITNPIKKSKQDGVYSGTTNGSGMITIPLDLIKSPKSIILDCRGSKQYPSINTSSSTSITVKIVDETGASYVGNTDISYMITSI